MAMRNWSARISFPSHVKLPGPANRPRPQRSVKPYSSARFSYLSARSSSTSSSFGEFSEAAGVPAKTIRYYDSVGLLPEPRRLRHGYRDYDASAAKRLEFIRAAQSLGLTLGEIRSILDFRDRGEVPCAHVASLIDRRARDISAEIAALERAIQLERLARRARRLSPRDCERANFCHIIEG